MFITCFYLRIPADRQKSLGNSMRGILCFPAQILRTPAKFPGHPTKN